MGKIIAFPRSKTLTSEKNSWSAKAPVRSNATDSTSRTEAPSQLAGIPIIQHALYFLDEAASEKGIKLTQTGAINRTFVQTFWERFTPQEEKYFRPYRELDCAEVTRIHEILKAIGHVRKFKNAIRLTPQGAKARERGPDGDLYRSLFLAGVSVWEWGYEDRYPDYEFIQDSAVELVGRLWHWPKSVVSSAEFTDGLFETVNEDGDPIQVTYEDGASFDPFSYDGLVRCFDVRFFQRFCVPFGLVVSLGGDLISRKPNDPFERTPFFESQFPTILEV
jgi:hypothetical protein